MVTEDWTRKAAEEIDTYWQPIETAPEATYVIVWVPNAGWCVATGTKDQSSGRWDWWCRSESEIVRPTHWKPLPDSPHRSNPEAVETIRKQIVKHCPFEPDIAYMPVRSLIAHRYFEYVGLEYQLDDAILRAVGVDPDKPDVWPFGSMIYDEYDNSFELQGVKGNWEPTPEQVQAILALGFARGWVVYKDGSECYYDAGRHSSPRLAGSSHRTGERNSTQREYLLMKRIQQRERKVDRLRQVFDTLLIHEINVYGGVPIQSGRLATETIALREAIADLLND